MKKCILCNGNLKNETIDYTEFGVSLGKFPAKVCEKCNESFFEPDIVDKIQLKSKEMGLFGLKEKVKIAKIGNSIAIRIPKRIADFLHLKPGKETSVYPGEDHKVIIECQ